MPCYDSDGPPFPHRIANAQSPKAQTPADSPALSGPPSKCVFLFYAARPFENPPLFGYGTEDLASLWLRSIIVDMTAIELEIEMTYRIARTTTVIWRKKPAIRTQEEKRFLALNLPHSHINPRRTLKPCILAVDPNDQCAIRRIAAIIASEAKSKGDVNELAIKHGLIRPIRTRRRIRIKTI